MINKIKAEVKRLMNNRDSRLIDGSYFDFEHLLFFIESLEKEPKCKVWHDINEEANLSRPVVLSDGDKYMSPPCTFLFKDMKGFVEAMNRKYKAEYTIWAYMEDLLSMTREPSPKIKSWVARDEDGTLVLGRKKPERIKSSGTWTKFGQCMKLLDEGLFPNLKFTDDPIEVELIISRVVK